MIEDKIGIQAHWQNDFFIIIFLRQRLSGWCRVQVNPCLSTVLSSKGFILLWWLGFYTDARWWSLLNESTCRDSTLFCSWMAPCSWASFCCAFWNPAKGFSVIDILHPCQLSLFQHPGHGTLHSLAPNGSRSPYQFEAESLHHWGGGWWWWWVSISPQIFWQAGFLFACVCVARELLNLKSWQEKLFDQGEGTLLKRCGTGINK